MARDYSVETYTKQLRNRIISAGFKSNPNKPFLSQEVALQAVSGGFPTFTTSSDGSSLNITIPCGCDGGEMVVGAEPEKDMDNENYTNELDPFDYQAEFFPGMADFVDENIVQGDKAEEDRMIASYWDDLGNDVFDDWGYFFLYDPASGKYYFPLLSPQNQEDGILSTQTFVAFGRTFTITHGWAAMGIFKLDISVADTLPFRFGAYGNMGSDGDEEKRSLIYLTTIDGLVRPIYYHLDKERGDSEEILYSYFIPKSLSQNTSQPYRVKYNDDDMAMVTKELTSGLLVYFVKGVDTKVWVANDVIATLV